MSLSKEQSLDLILHKVDLSEHGRGNQKVERGKAKYLGGNGRKTTGITKRVYRKNLKKIQVLENGAIVRRRVPVSLIRSGGIVKPVAKDPFALPDAN